jgi:GMP synthase (glutamine-hydrolysing)
MTETDEIIAEDPQDPAHDAAHDRVLIVDFGSQVTQLIARRVREAGV